MTDQTGSDTPAEQTDAEQATAEQPDAEQAQRRAGRALRSRSIFGVIIAAALTLLATTQPWWTVLIIDREPLEVAGTVASPALSALALASLALAAALALSGRFFRVVLGGLQALIGLTTLLAAIRSITSPVDASATVISDATGVAGPESIAGLVDSVVLTAWPWVAVAAGALALLVGVFILVTARRWPLATSKYQAVRLQDPNAPRSSVGDWDALSEGEDPTDESTTDTPGEKPRP